MKEKDSLNNDRLAHFVNRFDEYEKLVQKFPKILNPLPVLFIRVMGILLFLWFPFAIIDVRNMSDSVEVSFTSAIVVIFLNVLVFFWNQNFFVPKLFFKKKYVQYVLINFLCLLFVICLYQLSWITMSKWILGHIVSIYEVKVSLPIVFVKFLVLSFFICFMNIVLFVASVQTHLYYQRYTKKEIESNVKMEFLKRQLSPHFLFNSMNNVISMMDIDGVVVKAGTVPNLLGELTVVVGFPVGVEIDHDTLVAVILHFVLVAGKLHSIVPAVLKAGVVTDKHGVLALVCGDTKDSAHGGSIQFRKKCGKCCDREHACYQANCHKNCKNFLHR